MYLKNVLKYFQTTIWSFERVKTISWLAKFLVQCDVKLQNFLFVQQSFTWRPIFFFTKHEQQKIDVIWENSTLMISYLFKWVGRLTGNFSLPDQIALITDDFQTISKGEINSGVILSASIIWEKCALQVVSKLPEAYLSNLKLTISVFSSKKSQNCISSLTFL